MASSDRFYLPYSQAFDSAGNVEPGAKLYFYETSSTTPKNTYSDSALSAPNTNPVVADAAGRFGAIFLATGDYKVILTDSDDVQIWSADPVAKGSAASASTSTAGTVELATTAEGLVGSSASLVAPVAVVTEMIQQGFNYGTTGGTANAITGTPSRTPSALADGMKALLKASSTNTAATTLNWAGLGVTAVKTLGASGAVACAGGEIIIGNTYEFTYSSSDTAWLVQEVGWTAASIVNLSQDVSPDWTNDDLFSFDASAKLPKRFRLADLVAAQSDGEAATSNAKILTPGRAQYHPGVAKARVMWDATSGTPTAAGTSYNVGSLTDVGVGIVTINKTTASSTANFHPSGMGQRPSSTSDCVICLVTGVAPTTTSIQVTTEVNGGAVDSPYASVILHGDQ